MGGLAKRVVQRMELAATGQPGAKRFHLWSGHDTTVMPFLDLFGAWDGKWPPYAAMVTIELYRPKSGEGDAMVRMLYQGKDVTQKVRGCPQGGGQLCPYAAFKAVAAAAYAATDQVCPTTGPQPLPDLPLPVPAPSPPPFPSPPPRFPSPIASSVAYCNAARGSTNLPYPAPPAAAQAAGLELVQAQTVIRHGARTPGDPTNCAPGVLPPAATWECTGKDARGRPNAYSKLSAPAPTDAARLYDVQFVADSAEGLPGTCLIGQLVGVGQSQQEENGATLRAAYAGAGAGVGSLLPDTLGCAAGDLDPFMLVSDNFQRTRASAQHR